MASSRVNFTFTLRSYISSRKRFAQSAPMQSSTFSTLTISMTECREKVRYVLLQKHDIWLFTYEVYENHSTGYAVAFISAAATNTTHGPYTIIKQHLIFRSVSQHQLQPLIIISSCRQNSYSTFIVDEINKLLLLCEYCYKIKSHIQH